MKDKGLAHIGIGTAKGDEKATEAVRMAVESPLLDTTINGATHVIINISGDISLMDANAASMSRILQEILSISSSVPSMMSPSRMKQRSQSLLQA